MMENAFLQKFFARGNSYWLTRFVILRLLGLVYTIAFLVAARQLVPLVGRQALTPAHDFLYHLHSQLGSRTEGMLQLPTLFWFGCTDQGLSIFAWVGFALSLIVLGGYANAILLVVLWGMYMSIVHIGQIWYGYGWEIQLLETGFLSIFLCPLLDGRPFPNSRPPILVFWLFRWLGFRIMVGAGLIKLRGDECWRDLTCMFYHYETQPIPNPISRYLHFAPHWFHKIETLWNHTLELVVPWFSFGPRTARHVAGALLVLFQVFLIIIVNLSFLNYLTIIPFLVCFDDTFLRPAFCPPYQPRNNEQCWFAAMASPGAYPCTFHFVWKLLHNDPDTLSLLANNPFPDKPPHYIRARLYRYRFASVAEKGWWRRELISEWLPALSTDNQELRRLMGALHWYDYLDLD